MARTVGIGYQNYKELIENNVFYIDKTLFIKEWWEKGDVVTLISRPMGFGKTLNISMTEQFFSVDFANQGKLFEEMNIWRDEKYRKIQGTYPVISLSFANVKGKTYEEAKMRTCQILSDVYCKNRFLKDSGTLSDREIEYFDRISKNMAETDATISLHRLCDFMQRYYGKEPIVLLDEYDTPMHDAYANGYWNEMAAFLTPFFHSTFKTNPYMNRAIMTGDVCLHMGSIFSDLNNLQIVTTTSNKYEEAFGFTQEEVSNALLEFGLSDMEENVRDWYGGFQFGDKTDIFNPQSVMKFLYKKQLEIYHKDISSINLIGKLLLKGSKNIKNTMENLLTDGTLYTKIDEQIVLNQLDRNESALWSFLLANGYLKVAEYTMDAETGREEYAIRLTNKEVKFMIQRIIEDWIGN